MTKPLLELRDVSAGYGETHVLENIGFILNKGENLAVIGRNGVGKTTMLATVMGLTRLHKGSILLNGQNISKMPPHKRSHLGLGLVPQTRDIFPSLSVEENLVAAQCGDATLDEAYELFPRLKERRRNGGGQLSGGEQQMLAIARTLMTEPNILLLDEPLEGLAPVICDLLIQVFEKLSSDGNKTVVFVEQHADLVLSVTDKVLLLDGGKIVHQGVSDEIRSNSTLLERHIGIRLTH